jgi:hypothetical protein
MGTPEATETVVLEAGEGPQNSVIALSVSTACDSVRCDEASWRRKCARHCLTHVSANGRHS